MKLPHGTCFYPMVYFWIFGVLCLISGGFLFLFGILGKAEIKKSCLGGINDIELMLQLVCLEFERLKWFVKDYRKTCR